MSTKTRHVDSTNPERVRVMAATGKTEPTVMRTECTICGLVLKRGPVEPVSHGLCDVPECERVFLGDIDEGLIRTLARRSELAWGRYIGDVRAGLDPTDHEWRRHNDRFHMALRRQALAVAKLERDR